MILKLKFGVIFWGLIYDYSLNKFVSHQFEFDDKIITKEPIILTLGLASDSWVFNWSFHATNKIFLLSSKTTTYEN